MADQLSKMAATIIGSSLYLTVAAVQAGSRKTGIKPRIHVVIGILTTSLY